MQEIENDFGKSYLDNVTTPRGVADSVMDELIYGKSSRSLGPQRTAFRDSLREKLSKSDAGHMYEVNINANPEHFLDWDTPLSQQSEHVRRALGWTPEQEAAYASAQRKDIENLLAALTSDADYVETRSPTPKGVPPLDATGADIVKGNSVFGNPDAPNHSQALRSAGIPGIKYLDQGSRGAGEGTRNYVVFDPATIAILRRYGILGPVLGGGAVAASQYQPPQQAKKPTEY